MHPFRQQEGSVGKHSADSQVSRCQYLGKMSIGHQLMGIAALPQNQRKGTYR